MIKLRHTAQVQALASVLDTEAGADCIEVLQYADVVTVHRLNKSGKIVVYTHIRPDGTTESEEI